MSKHVKAPGIILWLTELAWLSEMDGFASPRRWHECVRPEIDETAALRQFYRLVGCMTKAGIPWQPVQLPREEREKRGPDAIGVRVLVTHGDIDLFRGEIMARKPAERESARLRLAA